MGGAIARACANAGHELCLVARKEHAVAPGVARLLLGDLADPGDVRRLCEELRELDHVRLLVHAAGRFRMASFGDLTVDEFDALFRVNVRAPFALTQALLPALRSSAGEVVFVNSSAGVNAPAATNGAYAATKHALRALADALRAEENANGVRVLSVYPGRTAGPLQERLHDLEGRSYAPERLLQPDDVAAAVMAALALPRTAETTDIHVRPMRKPAT